MIAVVLLASVIPSMALADGPVAPSTEIYVSAPSENGQNNESASTAEKGTIENPYETLTEAVTAINNSPENNFTIYIMSDLTVNSLARIADKHVTITSYRDQHYTITRGEEMNTATDNARSDYNPAMIEVTTPEGHGASVTLTNITLDDYGRHEGKYYLQAASYSDPYGKTEFSSNYANSTEKYEVTYDNSEIVQDAIIAGYGIYGANADIILGENAVLKNYGGMSAVRVTGGSTLTMEDGSKIIDDATKANWSPTAGYAKNQNNKQAKMDNGAAGAVWVQGTTAELKENSVISGVIGRAIYADGGIVTVNGSINNITGNANMWQGQDGVAVHVRGGADVTLDSHSVIDNENVTTKISRAVFVTNDSSLNMKQYAKICNLNGTAISGRGNHDGKPDNINIIIDGEIFGVKSDGSNNNAVNLNESDGLSCIIGENAWIHDNTVWAGALYAQGQGIKIDLFGKITNNTSTQHTAGIWLAHNFSGASLIMHPGAEITENFSKNGECAAVIVSAGTFTMDGGKIFNNVTYNKSNNANNLSGGVNVRKNGTFIMNGGEITDNVNYGFGGGISYSDDSANARVILNNGTITGNKMNATVVEDDGKYSVTGGTFNDITVKNNIANNVNRYISISDDVVIGNSKVYMQKYNFSIERPGKSVKFGNAAAACEDAVTTELSAQNLTQVVGSMWYQTEKNTLTLPLTVYDANYKQDKKLYAAVVNTEEDGTPVENATVSLYAVNVKSGGSFEVNLPGGAENGTAVVFLQEEDGTEADLVTVTPADITIYTGGQGYTGAVTGSSTTTSAGLPKPGFYVTLSDSLDKELKDALDYTGTEPLDLSGKLSFSATTTSAGTRMWTLKKYDDEGNSTVTIDGKKRYIYELVPEKNQDDIRMQFTDKIGQTITSDQFTISLDTLYQEYIMGIYMNSVDPSTVTVEIGGQAYPVVTSTGKLTVRGVVHESTNEIESSVPSDAENITAVAPDGIKYYINGSEIEVPDSSQVKLLIDDVVDNSKELLKKAITDKFDTIDSSANMEFKYFDLVDTSNGNVWITPSKPMQVFWPYPENTDSGDSFYVIHFEGLDRNYDSLENVLETHAPEQVDVEYQDNGLVFTVDSFSPYVLVWEKTSTSHNPGIIPTPDPTPTPDPEEPDQPELERDDHYAYIFGYEDNTIRPENDITRAEVATIFYRLLTDESREAYRTTDHDFTDVSADAWHVEPVATLAGAGLLAGYEDGSFRPDAPITRAEYAAIATRFDELAAAESNFTDISGHWAENAINAAYGAGWVGGYEDGTFRPDQNISRAEAMALINRVLERAVDSDGMLDEMTHWADNDPAAWYYADIQEATHSHTYEREEGEQYETWTDLVPHKVF